MSLWQNVRDVTLFFKQESLNSGLFVAKVCMAAKDFLHTLGIHTTCINTTLLQHNTKSFWNSNVKVHLLGFAVPNAVLHNSLLTARIHIHFADIKGVISHRTVAMVKYPHMPPSFTFGILDLGFFDWYTVSLFGLTILKQNPCFHLDRTIFDFGSVVLFLSKCQIPCTSTMKLDTMIPDPLCLAWLHVFLSSPKMSFGRQCTGK